MPLSRETKLREKGGQIPSKVQLQEALTAPPPPLLRYGHTSGFRGRPVLYCRDSGLYPPGSPETQAFQH